MPNLAAHCAISKQRTGFDFQKLHQWIDSPPEARFLGPDHRIERHAYNRDDMETIREFWESEKGSGWGQKAIVEWLFHVAIDNLSTAFKFSQEYYGEATYNLIHVGFATSGFINVGLERANDSEINKLFRKHPQDD